MYYQNNNSNYQSAIFDNLENLKAFGKALEINIDDIISRNRYHEAMILKNDLPTRYILDWICEVNKVLNTLDENKSC